MNHPALRPLSLASLLLALAACKPQAAPDQAANAQDPAAVQRAALLPAPPLPEPQFELAMPRLLEEVESAPQPPGEQRMAELRDLMLTALEPGYADERTRRLAQRSLDEAEDAVWIYEEGLDHENSAVRSQSAWQLGQRGRVAALPLLLRKLRLTYEPDRVVECWLVRAAYDLGCHGGLRRLVELMAYPDSSATAYQIAAQILVELERHPGDQATHIDVRRELTRVAEEWHRFGHAIEGTVEAAKASPRQPPTLDAIDPLLRARLMRHIANFNEFQLRPVDDAHFVLVRMGLMAVPFLDIALRAEEDELRRPAAEALIELGRPGRSLAAAALPLLHSPKTASVACRALGEIGATEALPHLLEFLDGEGLEKRTSAAGALGPLGDPRALPLLMERLEDEAEFTDVRVRAAWSVALLDPGLRFLKQAIDKGDGFYHGPTLRELIDEIGRRAVR